MGQMIVRKLDDEVIDRIKKKAKLEGTSAEQIARDTLTQAFKPSREELIRRMDAIRASSKPADLETTLSIMAEARAERDARPYIPGLDDDS
jgi:plasmid stability protein